MRPDVPCRPWSTESRKFLFWARENFSLVEEKRRRRSLPIKDYPDSGDKRVADLETALRNCGLRDGMVISNHHHLRDGDKVALMALEAAARIGVKDLMWFPVPRFPRKRARSN